MRIRSDPVMSIIEAKALLGDEASGMTDEEIQQMIDDLDIIAQYAIQLVQNFKSKNNQTD